MNNWLKCLENCLFPPTCLLCDNPSLTDKDICQQCCHQLFLNSQCCYQCGQPGTDGQHRCERCLTHPPPYQRTVAPFVYQGATAHLIKELKFNHQYKNAKLLGQLFSEQLKRDFPLPECIIPVPLHKHRYQQRGFNQSAEIARTVAKQLTITLELKTCIRHRDTPHQLGLPAKQRRENIKNAFSLVKPVSYSHVAVLDDVMTTGSTVAEIAVLLKNAGVATVEAWVCAKT